MFIEHSLKFLFSDTTRLTVIQAEVMAKEVVVVVTEVILHNFSLKFDELCELNMYMCTLFYRRIFRWRKLRKS